MDFIALLVIIVIFYVAIMFLDITFKVLYNANYCMHYSWIIL